MLVCSADLLPKEARIWEMGKNGGEMGRILEAHTAHSALTRH